MDNRKSKINKQKLIKEIKLKTKHFCNQRQPKRIKRRTSKKKMGRYKKDIDRHIIVYQIPGSNYYDYCADQVIITSLWCIVLIALSI